MDPKGSVSSGSVAVFQIPLFNCDDDPIEPAFDRWIRIADDLLRNLPKPVHPPTRS